MSASRTFVDKTGRHIVIDDDRGNVVALHEGKEVGRIVVDQPSGAPAP